MALEYYLDDDFSKTIYERAMRDPRTIPQSLSEISSAIKIVRAERDETISRFDETLAHLEELAAALRAKMRDASGRADARRQSVAVTARPVRRGLFEGSKKHRVFMIVTEVSKAEGSATIARVVAEMEKRGLFQNVRGNRTQNATNAIHQLKNSGHLQSAGHGRWAPTNGATE